MFGKQALLNFYRLNFANKSGCFIFARAYIFLLQLAVLIALVHVHLTKWSSDQLWSRILWHILIPLEFTSIPLHTLVCSVIGMDKVYILHLICSGIYWNYLESYSMYLSNYHHARLVASILIMLAYWIFNVRTRILYLSTFRFAVQNIDIDHRTLFRRLFKWWILMHVLLTPYCIWRLAHPPSESNGCWYLMFALSILLEIKMYLALTPDTDKFSYLFSTRSYLLEKFYIFCSLFYFSCWLTALVSAWGIVKVPTHVCFYLKIIGNTMWAIRWVWLYFYAKKKLEYYVFQCIDEQSSSELFDEFAFASKSDPWGSIGEYEPKKTLSIINLPT